jgi:hypothetical protein
MDLEQLERYGLVPTSKAPVRTLASLPLSDVDAVVVDDDDVDDNDGYILPLPLLLLVPDSNGVLTDAAVGSS